MSKGFEHKPHDRKTLVTTEPELEPVVPIDALAYAANAQMFLAQIIQGLTLGKSKELIVLDFSSFQYHSEMLRQEMSKL